MCIVCVFWLPKLVVQILNFLILTSYWSLGYYTHVSIIVSFICITNISFFQAHEVLKTTETPKIEPDKKSDLAPSVAPEIPRVTKPKQELSAAVKAESSEKEEPSLVPARKHETSPVPLEVQTVDVFKIPELTPPSRELVEVQLAKKPEPTPVSPDIRKPEPIKLPSISKAEPVIKEEPKVVLQEAPKVEPELAQCPPELPLAKYAHIQEKEQTPLLKMKSPPKRGIITKILCFHS